MDISKHIQKLFKDLQEYLKLETEYVKLEVIEEGSKALAGIFSFIFILVFTCISILLLGIFLGYWLTELTGSVIAGFGIATLIFFFILFLLLIFRKQLLERLFMNTAIKYIFKNIREKQQNKK